MRRKKDVLTDVLVLMFLFSGNTVEATDKNLLKKACNGGIMSSCSLLGKLEYKEGNHAEAINFSKKACDGGDINGCGMFGALEYEKGNHSKAKTLSKKACDGGDMVACGLLGELEHKKGNHVEAKNLYKKACDGGAIQVCRLLGVLENEKGNHSEAIKATKHSCDEGDMRGCVLLAKLEYERGNHSEAENLYKKACDGGDMFGCGSLGALEYDKGNHAEAKMLLKKSCDNGETKSCTVLKEINGSKLTKEQRNDLEVDLKKKSCDKSNCVRRGDMEEARENLSKAKTLWKKGCDMGDWSGCIRLGREEERPFNMNSSQPKTKEKKEEWLAAIYRAKVWYKKVCDAEIMHDAVFMRGCPLEGEAKRKIKKIKEQIKELTNKSEGLSAKNHLATAGLPSDEMPRGGMDPDVIRTILLNHVPQFRECYQKELDSSEKVFGGFGKFNFIIASSGYVSRARVDLDNGVPKSVNKCIIRELKRISFPKPQGGGTVEVNQPFNFRVKRR